MSLVLYRLVVEKNGRVLHGPWRSFISCEDDFAFWKSNLNSDVQVVIESSEVIEE